MITPKFFIIAWLILMPVLGWFQSSVSQSPVTRGADVWPTDMGSQSSDVNVQTLRNILKGSGMFPAGRTSVTGPQGQAGEHGEGVQPQAPIAPPFPTIIAASKVNGVHQVHLRTAAQKTVYAVAGDRLESGWMIKTVDPGYITAVFGEDEKEFKIRNYEKGSGPPE